MLSRSQRSNLNQENPQLRPHSNVLHPTKTPARQAQAGPSKSGLTGGKGLQTTAKAAGRVLGAKDGNKGKGAAGESLPQRAETSGCCDAGRGRLGRAAEGLQDTAQRCCTLLQLVCTAAAPFRALSTLALTLRRVSFRLELEKQC